ncbi:J domain-containing protein [Paraglaciecola sp. 20A4]|uniref:J domain-containing protein n=1 Tax=Paraglaciecola sp. 20A4 TaxID=2687288 RepID=UPI001408FA68|nr:J domain-containing protein [Paraglaciecola sp. 20A4]
MAIHLITTEQTDNPNDSSLVASIKKLWQKIEKNHKKNHTKKNKITHLYQRFQSQVLPHEQKMCTEVQALIATLIPFVSRKSLSETHREALLGWINQELYFIESNPFAQNIEVDNLRDALQQQLLILAQRNPFEENAENLQALAMMLEDLFSGELKLSDEELSNVARNPDDLQQYIDRMHKQLQEEHKSTEYDSNDDEWQDEPFDHADPNSRSKREQLALDKLFKRSELNKIYKRLAAKFHPDKEMDDAKKAEKHDLMQQLSAARKANDAFTLLSMYQQHCDDTDFNFDEATMQAIEKLLRQRIHLLERENHQLSSPDTAEGMVWQQLSGRSKKATAHNIESLISERQEITDNCRAMVNDITNLKILKEYLNERLDNIPPLETDFDIFSFEY